MRGHCRSSRAPNARGGDPWNLSLHATRVQAWGRVRVRACTRGEQRGALFHGRPKSAEMATGGPRQAGARRLGVRAAGPRAAVARRGGFAVATGRTNARELELRAVNLNKNTENTQLVQDLHATVRDLVSVIQR